MSILRHNKFEYLKLEDFACKCCGANDMQDYFLWMLDNAMTIAGFKFDINSGFRCPKHNKEVFGSATSSHLKGWAADIAIENNWYRFMILNALILVGIERFVIYKEKNFIHCDIDPGKPQKIISLV